MQKKFLLFVCVVLSFLSQVNAAYYTSQRQEESLTSKKELVYSKNLSVKDAELILGRELSLFEKVGFTLKKKKFIKILNEYESVPAADDSAGTNGWAIAGLICGILLPPLGIIFSAIALGQIKKTGQKGKGLAIAGLVCGIVFTVLLLL